MSRGLRQLGAMLSEVLKLATVTRSVFSGAVDKVQSEGLDEDDIDDSPVYGPQGVAFRTPEGAEVLIAQSSSDPTLTCALGTDQRGQRPTEKPGGGEVPEGCGGLHYLGTWGVYLGDDGKTYLGGAEPGDDFVAMAAAVLSELNDIRAKFDAHIHTTTATIGATATVGVIAPPSPGMGAAGSVAAANTKAK